MQEDARRCKKYRANLVPISPNISKCSILGSGLQASQAHRLAGCMMSIRARGDALELRCWKCFSRGVSIWFTGPEKFTHHPSTYGGFLKWEYPQIIRFHRMFHCKPSILGYPHCRKPPYPFHDRRSAESMVQSNKNWTECQHFPR